MASIAGLIVGGVFSGSLGASVFLLAGLIVGVAWMASLVLPSHLGTETA